MLHAIGRWSRCYDTTMDSFDRVAIFNFPLSFPIESVHEGDIKQLVRPSFPRLSVRLMRSPPWYTGIFHAILSTPVSPAKRHHGAVSSRGCVGHEFVKLESCLFPFPPPPYFTLSSPFLNCPARLARGSSRKEQCGGTRVRKNVDDDTCRRLLLFLPAVSIFDSGEKEYGGNITSDTV